MKKSSTKVMVFGTFDLLHQGHIYFLTEAKKHGDCLIVVVARDVNVEQIKDRKTIHDEHHRKKAIEDTLLADKVILGDKKNFFKPILVEKPDIICLGHDQNSRKVEETFPKIRYIKMMAHKPHIYKTSKIIKKLKA